MVSAEQPVRARHQCCHGTPATVLAIAMCIHACARTLACPPNVGWVQSFAVYSHLSDQQQRCAACFLHVMHCARGSIKTPSLYRLFITQSTTARPCQIFSACAAAFLPQTVFHELNGQASTARLVQDAPASGQQLPQSKICRLKMCVSVQCYIDGAKAACSILPCTGTPEPCMARASIDQTEHTTSRLLHTCSRVMHYN